MKPTKKGETFIKRYKIPRLTLTQVLVLVILRRENNYIYSIWIELKEKAPNLNIGLSSVREIFLKLKRERYIREFTPKLYTMRVGAGPKRRFFSITDRGVRTAEFYLNLFKGTQDAISKGKFTIR